MSKGLVVKLGDETSVLELSRVTREKLYGRKRRVVVDESGAPCAPALLTVDGATLIPPGGVASAYLTRDFDVLERKSLTAIDPQTQTPLTTTPSTLGVEQTLEGPVPAQELLDCAIASVYQLPPEELGEDLLAELERGQIFKAPFNYRAGTAPSTIYLVKNDHGVFGLVGEPVVFRWCEPDDAPELPEEEAAFFEDDLDFEMF